MQPDIYGIRAGRETDAASAATRSAQSLSAAPQVESARGLTVGQPIRALLSGRGAAGPPG